MVTIVGSSMVFLDGSVVNTELSLAHLGRPFVDVDPPLFKHSPEPCVPRCAPRLGSYWAASRKITASSCLSRTSTSLRPRGRYGVRFRSKSNRRPKMDNKTKGRKPNDHVKTAAHEERASLGRKEANF